jgi:hypothetical protein
MYVYVSKKMERRMAMTSHHGKMSVNVSGAHMPGIVPRAKGHHSGDLEEADLQCVGRANFQAGRRFKRINSQWLIEGYKKDGRSTYLRLIFPLIAKLIAFINSVVFGTSAKQWDSQELLVDSTAIEDNINDVDQDLRDHRIEECAREQYTRADELGASCPP